MMKDKKTIKQIYNLDLDDSEEKSGLIKWYNHLLGKTPDDLDEVDVSKMIRQKILPKLAIDKAIDILKDNPQIGEMYEGDVLNTLYFLAKDEQLSQEQLEKLKNTVIGFEMKISDFEWMDVEEKNTFLKNMQAIKAL
ncbi:MULTISPECIES: contact-dependent growth inhibition system immunity protein [Escherichia]|uniref:contact-dependent growth inhibition system immunity protein n=1 Tax=Escherichia TaxID=561 RepID=UPI0012FF7449|nr:MULTISPECIES: contact-dependent growth inhibition system immunity protein [Escherichia]MED9310250.1 contact-dependent growth inhibition system immunity protein [Escherichia coli]